MQYWAVIDNERKGPMTLDDLTKLNLAPDTLVWREGLAEWIPAKDLCELSTIFANSDTPEPPEIENEATVAGPAQPQYTTQPAEPQNTQWNQCGNNNPKPQGVWNSFDSQGRPCPPTYLVLSIIVLACCCQIFGIIALVYSTQVKSLYQMGDYDKSYNYSRKAFWWSIAGLALGVVASIVYVIIQFFVLSDTTNVIQNITSYMP